jgi:hypothetical protein
VCKTLKGKLEDSYAETCVAYMNREDCVAVVRCKDCGYWIHVEDGYGECTNRRFHLDGHPDPTMEFNGFCSCGERKDNERKAD